MGIVTINLIKLGSVNTLESKSKGVVTEMVTYEYQLNAIFQLLETVKIEIVAYEKVILAVPFSDKKVDAL